MDNSLKNVICKIPMKSEMEDRIIAFCRAEVQKSRMQNAGKNKKAVRIGWERAAAAVACGVIILFLFIALSISANNRLGVPAANESSIYGSKKTDSTSDNGFKAQSGAALPTETRPVKTVPAATKASSATAAKTEGTSLAETPSVKMSIRKFGDFISMGLDGLKDYYGRKIIPGKLPKDLVLQKDNDWGICKRNDKTPDYHSLQSGFYKTYIKDGEIYFDDNTITYRSSVNDRELNIFVAKDRFPTNNIGDTNRFSEITVAGIRVRIAHYNDAPYSSSDMYDALVMVDQVGYYLSSNNLTKDEFMSALTSIIE